MDEWLRSLVPWGTEVIVWTQSHSTGGLVALSRFFTYLGYEEFYLFVLPLVYWCLHKRIAVALGYLSLLSVWVNGGIKYVLKIPRPADPQVRVLWPDPRPSFPSGHAQNAVVNWGYLAYRFGKPAFWLVAIVAILGIGLSRVVLGAHYPQDVLGGWFLGFILVTVYAWLAPLVGLWVERQQITVQLVLAIGVPLVLVFAHPADTEGYYPAQDAVTAMGALTGLGVGIIMERAWLCFLVQDLWWRRVVRFLVGLILVLAFYVGPKLALVGVESPPVEGLLRFVRYAMLGWVVAFLAPWVFVRLRLARRE